MDQEHPPVVLGTQLLIDLTVEHIRSGLYGEAAADAANAAWEKLNALIATCEGSEKQLPG